MSVRFVKPSNPQAVTVWAGRNVVSVEVVDEGHDVDGVHCFAYAIKSRVYGDGTDPGDDPPADAVNLTLVDQRAHRWSNVAVYEAACSSGGSSNVAYIWAHYQKPGNIPIFVTVRSSFGFSGTY